MKQLLLAFATLLALQLPAQNFEIGLSLGHTSYIGDLVCLEGGGHLKEFAPLVGAFVKFNQNRFSTKLGFMTSSISATPTNSHHPERGLWFKSPIREFALTGELNLFYINLNQHSFFTPYVFGGMAIYQFNPKAEYDGEWVELQPLGTEGQGMDGYNLPYQLTQLAIPFGGGIKYKVNKRLMIGAEVGIRKLFTDYLDDVGGTEVNFKELISEHGETAAMVSVPANQMEKVLSGESVLYTRGGAGNDMYYTCQINLSFTIGKVTPRCPRF